MLKINLICVGKLKEKYLVDAFMEYERRIKPFAKFNLIEIKEAHFVSEPSQAEINQAILAEGKEILKHAKNTTIIAMCIEGKLLSSVELSTYIENICKMGISELSFIIGGSWGLSDEVKEKAKLKLSVSKMTFPHQLFRVMLEEQIYRALNLINNGKYHK